MRRKNFFCMLMGKAGDKVRANLSRGMEPAVLFSLVLVLLPSQASAQNSFANRIAGANLPGGVASIVSSYPFETALDTCTAPCDTWAPGKQISIMHHVSISPSLDCTMAADGACSLKFTNTVGSFQGDAGWMEYNFSSNLATTFGEGQEFFVQYKIRLDAALLGAGALTNGEGLKHDIITEGDSATVFAGDCLNSPAEVVTITDPAFAGPMLYSNCGYSGGSYAFMQQGYQPISLGGIASSNFLDQDAAGCPHYGGRGIPTSDPSCFLYTGDEWFTIQKHIRIGTWGQPSSVIEAWLAHAGQPAVLISNAADAAIVNDGSGGASGKYGKISLSTYATNATFNVNAAAWFDNLIVATRRIPDPDVGTPNAPDGLQTASVSSGVHLTWRVNSHNGTAQDDTGFLIQRCTGTPETCFPNPQPGFANVATTAAGTATFTDSTVTIGTTYTYRVQASNAAGKSAYAASICFNGGPSCGGTVTANGATRAPSAPTGLVAAAQ